MVGGHSTSDVDGGAGDRGTDRIARGCEERESSVGSYEDSGGQRKAGRTSPNESAKMSDERGHSHRMPRERRHQRDNHIKRTARHEIDNTSVRRVIRTRGSPSRGGAPPES
jgi:hypothetical protein